MSLPRVIEILRRYITDLKDGKVDLRDLIFTVGISKYIHKYRQNNFSLAALKQLRREGIELMPGQFIYYIVTNHKARRHIDKVKIVEAIEDEDGYDEEFYTKHLLQATESLFSPFGFTMDKLNRVLMKHEQSTIPKFAIECGDA